MIFDIFQITNWLSEVIEAVLKNLQETLEARSLEETLSLELYMQRWLSMGIPQAEIYAFPRDKLSNVSLEGGLRTIFNYGK